MGFVDHKCWLAFSNYNAKKKTPSKSLKAILYTASSFKYFVIKNISEL